MAVRLSGNASYFGNIKQGSSASFPDLAGGSCLTPQGMEIMDAYVNSFGGGRNGEGLPGARENAQKLCQGCAKKVECGKGALQGENPPGAWGGMYGGMTPKQRRAAVEAEKKLEASDENRDSHS